LRGVQDTEAKLHGIDKILTFDKGFKGIKGIKAIL
jgi:predicted nucleic acid-binding protein